MNTHLTVLAALLVLGYGTVSHAEGSEGNGEPFPVHSGGQRSSGSPFVSDNGQTNYPLPTGNTTQASSLAALAPAYGAEAVVNTAASLPSHATEGTVAYAQGKSLERAMAPVRVREVGVSRPKG